ncbi:MAG: hypothetical protein NTX44_05485 [Ignavibacteriales bacterium]|nr:hypothetical protein [Ignavibacteriales bacterium]
MQSSLNPIRAALADEISQSIALCIKVITIKTPVVSEERIKITMVPHSCNLSLHQCQRMTSIRILIIAIGFFCVQAQAQQSSSKPDWSTFQFLLGEWIGEGSGDPGQGNGIFTFSLDLQDHILIRHNQSDYPETKTHAAFSHNDLMVIYQAPGHSVHAIYFDNEGHTIQYTTNISDNGKSITFISDSLPAVPQFRLTYTSLADDSLFITFEIAPPAKPYTFSKYLEGRAHRTKSNSAINSEKKK